MQNPSDEVIERVTQEIRRLFSEVELTPEEKAFVRENGTRLANEAFQMFVAAKDMERMRPLVAAMAIAATFGPSQVWDSGVEALARPTR